MFYSQTFLARKGPLGTVWRAAHQLRVKKSQYTSTDIPSTVDRIMFPEVPIALRLSAFLLLGIVRIYSKKVEILSDDCNAALTWLRKAFASIELTLPEDARQAPVQSITLPETFDLDALNLDDGNLPEENQDNHLRRIEDITLADQIPTGRDPYIAITFDEDIMVDSTNPGEIPDLGVRPMETDFQPPSPVSRNVAFVAPDNATDVIKNDYTATQELPQFHDSSPPDQSEFLRVTRSADKSPQSVPEIEVLRGAPPEMGDLPLLSPPSNMEAETLRAGDQTPSHKSMLSPIMEDDLALSIPRRSLRLTPSSLREDSTTIGLSPHQSVLRSGVSPPELALLPTPPNQQRKPRQRKRKQFFDESTVLTNKFMKKSLEDHSDLVRRRRNIPWSSLGRWKLANVLRKEQVFNQPSITGLCSDLRNIFDKDYEFAKPRLKKSSEEDSSRQTNLSPPRNETNLNSSVPQPFPSPTLASPHARTGNSPVPDPAHDPDHQQVVLDNNEDATLPEIERLRHVVDNNESVTLPDAFPSWPTPPRRDDPNPMWSKDFGSPLVSPMEASTSTRGFCSFDDLDSGRPLEFEMATIPEERDVENSELPNITTFMKATEPEDLYFLEADNSPAGSPATQRVDSLSVRTRAVARYVKSLTPTKSTPEEDASQNLSLNKILQGKTRKLCARMFYETLVLKSYSLVDMQQDEPYGDIILQPTPKLSKTQI